MPPKKDKATGINQKYVPKSLSPEDRKIEILEGEGWCIQRDNMLPRMMKQGETIFIKEGEIHRVLKGTTDLKIRINEM